MDAEQKEKFIEALDRRSFLKSLVVSVAAAGVAHKIPGLLEAAEGPRFKEYEYQTFEIIFQIVDSDSGVTTREWTAEWDLPVNSDGNEVKLLEDHFNEDVQLTPRKTGEPF